MLPHQQGKHVTEMKKMFEMSTQSSPPSTYRIVPHDEVAINQKTLPNEPPKIPPKPKNVPPSQITKFVCFREDHSAKKIDSISASISPLPAPSNEPACEDRFHRRSEFSDDDVHLRIVPTIRSPRYSKHRLKDNQSPPSIIENNDDQQSISNNTMSIISSQSSTTISSSDPISFESFSLNGSTALVSSFDYGSIGDEQQHKRGKELNAIVHEFLKVQLGYVDLLQKIGEGYPKFLRESTQNKVILDDQRNVIARISGHLKTIHGVHETIFLHEFQKKIEKWDIKSPDFAGVLKHNAEFLKVCCPFLKEKRTLQNDLRLLLESDNEFASATKAFEERAFGDSLTTELTKTRKPDVKTKNNSSEREKGGSISIIMQLDSVHQNLVRYKLLLERYLHYLPKEIPEFIIADEALKKLIAISNNVNDFLADADADQKLLELHRKIGDVFDVWAPSRKLLHQGNLHRQTRKDLQLRHLFLFSDYLLIFRYALGSDERFDNSSCYRIPVEKIRIQVKEHEDYEQEFILISPKKSSAFVAKTKRERDLWVGRIKEAYSNARDLRRMQKCAKNPNNLDMHHLEEQTSDNLLPNDDHISPPTVNEVTSQREESALQNSGTSPTRKSGRRRYKAPWIPDHKTTKCLMEGCSTKFDLFHRRHHCRECGSIICDQCVGEAPIYSMKFQKQKVCPECFDTIKSAFEKGSLFPKKMIHNQSSAEVQHNSKTQAEPSLDVQTTYDLNDKSLLIAHNNHFVRPSKLFKTPENVRFKQKRKPSSMKEADHVLVSGQVYLRKGNRKEQHCWAKLTSEMLLEFYEAELDDEPAESYLIHGYSLRTTDADGGGMLFELIHRNQIQTERGDQCIIFHIYRSKLADRWHQALESVVNELQNP